LVSFLVLPIGDSIHLLSAVASLCKKYQKAETSAGTMNSAVEELTESIGNNDWISEWKKLEEAARTKRGRALMIYNVSYTPGKS
jgi:hypothetical protein